MTFYEEMAQLGIEMLAEFGMVASLTSAPTGFDKPTGRQTGQTGTSKQVQALVEDREVEDDDGRKVVRTIATMQTQPGINDIFKMGNRTWKVTKVTEVQPTDTPIIYFAELA